MHTAPEQSGTTDSATRPGGSRTTRREEAMRTTINLTMRHIMRGSPCDCEHCPIAQAVMDHTDAVSVSVCNIHVTARHIDPDGSPYYLRATLPAEARLFIDLIDRHDDVRPFSFELEWQHIHH